MKKNLIIRSITGALFVGVVLSAIYFGAEYTAILFFIFMLLGLHEMLAMLRGIGVKPLSSLVYTLSTILYAYICFSVLPFDINKDWFWDFVDALPFAFILLTFGSFIFEMYRKSEHPWINIASVLMSVFYIALPFASLNYIRNPFWDALYGSAPILIAFFLFVWANDTFAYIFGVLFGKHRLFERLSPKKSWEGAIGGGVMSIILAYVWGRFNPEIPLVLWIVMALITVVFSIFGDLIESMLKRSCNVKDSGNLLPGHGGVLDRFDSVLLAAPVVAILFAVYWRYLNYFVL